MAEAPPSATDHLVLAVPSLKDGIRNIAGLLGITPAVGGKHPQWRTQNAIVSLGPRVYLEVMGPDDQPADPTKPRPFGMDQLASPKLVTWAVRSDDLQETVLTARSAGINLGEVLSGSRKRPDGVLLQWQMTDLTKDRENGVVPFFINWGTTTPHPAEASPQGCTLEGLRVFHPDPVRVAHIFAQLGIELAVDSGVAGIEATIHTPQGRIVLK